MERILEAIHLPKKASENEIPATVKTENFENDEPEIPSSGILLQQTEKEETCLSSKSPISEAHYDNDESVTIVYPPPLLSTNEGELVNLVHLPNDVNSDIHLEGSDLHYDSNVVLQQGFESGNHIAVITTDSPDGQLELLEPQGTDAIAYFEADSEESASRTNADAHSLLSDHLIHIPTSDTEGNSQTLSLSLSVVNDSFISSLKLGSLPFAVGGDISEALSIPVNLQASNLVPVSHSDSQEYIITNLSVKEVDDTIKPKDFLSKDQKSKEGYPIKKRVKQGQVGRPPRVQPSKKLLGSGPMAISAQGVIQEINNRLVTVLPRPEDLKKLVENKQIVPLKSGNSSKSSFLKQKENKAFYQDEMDDSLTPLDARLNDSIGAEDIVHELTMGDGEQSSSLLVKEKPSPKSTTPFQKFNFPKIRKRRGRKRGRARVSYTVSSTGRKPGRLQKVETLVQGLKGPRVIHTKSPNSVAERDRELSSVRKEDTEVIAVGEKQEKEDFGDLPWGHLDGIPSVDEEKDGSRRKLPPRRRGTRYQKLIQLLKKTEDDEDAFTEGEDFSPDFSINPKAPPILMKPKGMSGPGKRGRPRKSLLRLDSSSIKGDGTRIIQLSENLRPIVTASSPSILIKEGRSAAPGQTNDLNQQPEQSHRLVITFEQPDTGEMVVQHISVQSQKTKEASHPSCSLASDPKTNISIVEQQDDVSDEDTATIFVSENGEYEKGFECDQCDKIIPFKRDYIRHLRQVHDIRPYECDQCRKTFTSKSTLQNHKFIHNLEKPHRCNQCGMGFHSPQVLKLHLETHSDKQFSCEECGKTFMSSLQLKKHLLSDDDLFDDFRCKDCKAVFNCVGLLEEHSCKANELFQCDICRLQFTTTSGLNRHRKVHKRSKDFDEMETEWKCNTCNANFSYEESLLSHVQKFHWGSFEAEKTILPMEPEDEESSVIQQLQQKLDEGYAPKTSELYDEPEESETMEKNLKDPFLCGICNSSFIDVEILCDHYSSCHTGEQKFHCDACTVGCSTEKQLQRHKAIHVEEEQKSLVPLPDNVMPFICNFCGKSFKKNTDLEKHLKTHSQEKPFKCQYCSASFSIKSALDKHLMVHTGQRPFRCDICLKTFRQSAALVRHKLWTHRLKNQNKCDICSKTFFTKDLLLFHLDTHGADGEVAKENLLSRCDDPSQKERENGKLSDEQDEDSKKRTCEYCGKVFSTFVALLTHKITHKLSASYKCDLCHRTFREKRYLKKHRLTHKGHKSWSCDICRKSFTTKLTLIRHAHVHLREALRPDVSYTSEENGWTTACTLPSSLRCDRCNLEFSHKSHFVRHKLLHSGIPLLKCGLCSRMFVHKSDMIRHKVMHSFMFTCDICGRNFHKRPLYILHRKRHFDDKPFKCDKCHKSFSTSGNFNIHKRIHSGEKPYWCDICDYKCSQSGRLMKHKRMHAGIKPYSCDICEKQFVNPESVRVHQRVHTGERPYRCPHCLKTFINNNSLKHHLREHLKEETFKCDQCPHKFRRQDHYDKHKQFHVLQQRYQENANLKVHGNFVGNLYMCEVCGRVFDKKKYLYTHHNVHSRMRLFTCSYCNKDLASRLALKNHMLIHTGVMPHKCCFCEKEFRSLSNLKRHEKVHCSQEVFSCEECGETFYGKDLLEEHKQEHINFMMINPEVETDNSAVNQQLYVFDPVEDGINEAMDSTQQLLVENSQQQFLVDAPQSLLVFQGGATETYPPEIPEPEPPVNEPPEEEKDPEVEMPPEHSIVEEENPPSIILNNKLLEPGAIVMEERTFEKPHQCDVCSKTFAKKQYLTKHKYRHREVKPHACDVCGKRFAQKFEVSVHKIKHTGERPYQCEICKKLFRSKVNLQNHKMRHTGEYPYLCSVCHKGLSTQLQLEKHVLLHTGSLQYPCQHCTKGFSQRLSLERHLAKVHNFEGYKSGTSTEDSLQISKPFYHMEGMENPLQQVADNKRNIVATMVGKRSIKEEGEDEEGDMTEAVEAMDISTIEGEREDPLSIFPVQQEYLKLLGTSADTEEAKFLASILHSRTEGTSGVAMSGAHVEVDSGS